tara:strand:+ start:1213 stop:1638 length:426 start_codon:yes stop_codon:yes gene_type:complete
MGTAMYDALEDMRTLLKDEWGTTSIVGDTPEIKVIWERKVVGFADYTRDTILLTPKKERIDYFGLYGSDFLHHVNIQIEVWTYMNQTRLDNMVGEVIKIIKNNIRRTNFVDLMITGSVSSSETYRNIWKHVLTAKYRKLNP